MLQPFFTVLLFSTFVYLADFLQNYFLELLEQDVTSRRRSCGLSNSVS